jgi:hypothetical protein
MKKKAFVDDAQEDGKVRVGVDHFGDEAETVQELLSQLDQLDLEIGEMEASKKEIKAALLTYMKDYGADSVHDGPLTLSWWKSERRKLDGNKLVQQYGVDISTIEACTITTESESCKLTNSERAAARRSAKKGEVEDDD